MKAAPAKGKKKAPPTPAVTPAADPEDDQVAEERWTRYRVGGLVGLSWLLQQLSKHSIPLPEDLSALLGNSYLWTAISPTPGQEGDETMGGRQSVIRRAAWDLLETLVNCYPAEVEKKEMLDMLAVAVLDNCWAERDAGVWVAAGPAVAKFLSSEWREMTKSNYQNTETHGRLLWTISKNRPLDLKKQSPRPKLRKMKTKMTTTMTMRAMTMRTMEMTRMPPTPKQMRAPSQRKQQHRPHSSLPRTRSFWTLSRPVVQTFLTRLTPSSSSSSPPSRKPSYLSNRPPQSSSKPCSRTYGLQQTLVYYHPTLCPVRCRPSQRSFSTQSTSPNGSLAKHGLRTLVKIRQDGWFRNKWANVFGQKVCFS